jgi:hypothetical protein
MRPIASKGVPPIDRNDYLGRFPKHIPLRIHPEVLHGAAGNAQATLEKFKGTQETPGGPRSAAGLPAPVAEMHCAFHYTLMKSTR